MDGAEIQQFMVETILGDGEGGTVLVDTWPDTAFAEPRSWLAEAMHAWHPPGHSNITKGTSNTSCGLQLRGEKTPCRKTSQHRPGKWRASECCSSHAGAQHKQWGTLDPASVHRQAFKSC